MNLLYKLKSGWTTLKFIRVGLSVLILFSSIAEGHIPGIILGAFLTGISLITEGVCCFGGACSVTAHNQNSTQETKIEYEELDSK